MYKFKFLMSFLLVASNVVLLGMSGSVSAKEYFSFSTVADDFVSNQFYPILRAGKANSAKAVGGGL